MMSYKGYQAVLNMMTRRKSFTERSLAPVMWSSSRELQWRN